MTETISVLAPAKVNLTLHVTGLRADGYHLLDSLVVFADFGDRLTLTPGPEMSLEVSGPFAAGVPVDGRNSAWQAAVLAGWTGHIHLEKALPHGAGIGSGSSDAAALLNAVEYGEDGLDLGADVPVCRMARAARMRGIGEQVEAVDGLPRLFAVLVNPGVHVPTPRVFKGLISKENAAMGEMPVANWMSWLSEQRNDLEAPAVDAYPVIGEVLKALSVLPGVRLVRMSGSGATCFALFDSYGEAELAAKDVREARPDWWVQDVSLS